MKQARFADCMHGLIGQATNLFAFIRLRLQQRTKLEIERSRVDCFNEAGSAGTAAGVLVAFTYFPPEYLDAVKLPSYGLQHRGPSSHIRLLGHNKHVQV